MKAIKDIEKRIGQAKDDAELDKIGMEIDGFESKEWKE